MRCRSARQYSRLPASFSKFAATWLRAQLIDGTEHDVAVQLLDRAFLVDEPLRQILEQLGVRRPLARDAEVARRVDQTRTEVPLPDPVDDHARGDRLPVDGIRELEPPAAFGEGRRAFPRTAPTGNDAARRRPGCTGCRAC
jgi:hypothetical protein